jgi:hypothetical protein
VIRDNRGIRGREVEKSRSRVEMGGGNGVNDGKGGYVKIALLDTNRTCMKLSPKSKTIEVCNEVIPCCLCCSANYSTAFLCYN